MSVMHHMTRDQLLRAQASARIFQERADNALQPWNIRAPAPVLGQDVHEYRRDLAVKLKKQLPENHKLHKVQYRGLDDDILSNFEPQLYAAVHAEAHNPATVLPGTMRKVEKVNPGGTKFVEYIGALREDHPELGQRCFIEDFKAPVFRAKIRNPDTHPGWFTGNARVSQAGVGMDPPGWHDAYRSFQTSQGYLG
jgi:hypothetical protein